MQTIFKDINLQKRRRKTPKKINLLTFYLLTQLIESTPNNLLSIRARPAKKTKTSKEIFGAVVSRDKIATMTSLQQVFKTLRRKEKTFLTLSISTVKKKRYYYNKYPQNPKRVKKLVLVLATSMAVTIAREEVVVTAEIVGTVETTKTSEIG